MQIYKKITTYLSKTLILHRLKQNVMLIFQTQSTLKRHISQLTTNNQTIGFIPTMGAIHQGHLSLIEKALNENDEVIVSIFVNPTQFNNLNDLEKYPRTLDRDTALIKTVSENIIIFAPTVDDIYEGYAIADKFEYDGLENEMEGINRPGHFDGVGTIVKKLFEIVTPTRAYFGEKDFQQLQIIRKMVAKNHLPIQIVGCPIFRQADGLAMSSRNELLSAQAKKEAPFIYKTLLKAQQLFKTETLLYVKLFVEKAFAQKADFSLEYFEIAEEETLKPALEKEAGKKYRGFLVAHLDNVRLIDNISLN